MRYFIEHGGRTVAVDVERLSAGRLSVKLGDAPARIVDARIAGGLVHLLDGERSLAMEVGPAGPSTHVFLRGFDAHPTVVDPAQARRQSASGGGGAGGRSVRSPMPGKVVKALVAPGDHVVPGQGVIIVEAMKMENELKATVAGKVDKILVKAGDLVESRQELVTLEPEG